MRVPPAGLSAVLAVPPASRGIVIFAHGSGSGRLSPRNQFVATHLQDGGLATLLFDLLTPDEEALDRQTAQLRFDIQFLADRLNAAVEWLKTRPDTRALAAGCFGASTGGGAALVAAAQRPKAISAVVSRGGRPDLAGDWLPSVQCPTLLLVGGEDGPVIGMNRQAFDRLGAPEKRLDIIPGATHLFEEPGTLEQVAALARQWFLRYLPAS